MNADQSITKLKDRNEVEMVPGIYRRTMSYNDDSMLCHFIFKKGAAIPLHKHEAVQNGYVISGRVRFFKMIGGQKIEIDASAGTGYLFESFQQHGAECLEDSELIECFTPVRPEYADG